MKNISELEELVKTNLRKALEGGQNSDVVRCARLLEQLESLRTRYKTLTDDFETLKLQVKSSKDRPVAKGREPMGEMPDTLVRGRGAGRGPRQNFVERCRQNGIRLIRETETLYRNQRGKAIAMPFANLQKNGEWWLGTTDKKYGAIVLICRNEDGVVWNFVLDEHLCAEHWDKFSRSGDSVKFHVYSAGPNFFLRIPQSPPVSLNRYADAFSSVE